MVRIDARHLPEPNAKTLATLPHSVLAGWLAICLAAVERQETALVTLFATLSDGGLMSSEVARHIQEARLDLVESIDSLDDERFVLTEGGVS